MPTQEITGISTEEFWKRYAKKGAIGLGKPSLWAHAFIFTGERPDGFDWLAESDLVVESLRLRRTIGENFTPRREGTRFMCREIKCKSSGFGKGKTITCLTSHIRKFILPQLQFPKSRRGPV